MGSTTASATKELFKAIGQYRLQKVGPGRSDPGLERMRLALTAGANWKAPAGPGRRDAAFTAATCDDARPLELLFEHGVSPAHANRGDGTLLHRAASFGCVKVVKMLLARGIAVDVLDAHGRTPLDQARAWKHGQDVVPLLTRLTKAAAKTRKAPQELPGADLPRPAMMAEIARLAAGKVFRSAVVRALKRHATAAFVGKAALFTDKFLLELAGGDDIEVLAAGLAAATRATTRQAAAKRHASPDAELAHLGDLTIRGDCDARILVVSGDLKVTGRLTNWEGRVICVGGSLQAKAIVSEGPLWVGGDLGASRGYLGTYNDYGTIVRGALVAPVAVQDEHAVEAKRWKVGKRYRSWDAVPQAERPKIRKRFGLGPRPG